MNQHNQAFCQSCGMPMGDTSELFGTEADGSKSGAYCTYCYQQGEFTFHGTMEEMIEGCIAPVVEHNPDMTPEQARHMMQRSFPELARWKA